MEDTFDEKIEFLNYNISIQKKFKDIIVEYIQGFVNLNNISSENSANTVIEFLNSLKNSLSLCDENIEKLESLFSSSDDEFEVLKFVMENTLKIQNSVYAISQKSTLKAIDEPLENTNKQLEASSKSDTSQLKTQPEMSLENYNENTLIISETKGNVVFPFKISEVKSEFENNPQNYSSIDDVIQKKYTVPISEYKSPIMSRFKEAYKLMREKEKSSIFDALDLGLELAFNSLLNPAIISACKNLTELDIYLDCLDSNELEKFDIFNIKYEVLPKK